MQSVEDWGLYLTALGRAQMLQHCLDPKVLFPYTNVHPGPFWNENLLAPPEWACLPILNNIYHLIWYDFSHMFSVY